MWRSRIRLRRTSVFSYLTGSFSLAFFYFFAPGAGYLRYFLLLCSPSAVKHRNQPVTEGNTVCFFFFFGKRESIFALLQLLVSQSVLDGLSLLGRSPICHLRPIMVNAGGRTNGGQSEREKIEKERVRVRAARLISLSLSILLTLSLSLSLSIFIYYIFLGCLG